MYSISYLHSHHFPTPHILNSSPIYSYHSFLLQVCTSPTFIRYLLFCCTGSAFREVAIVLRKYWDLLYICIPHHWGCGWRKLFRIDSYGRAWRFIGGGDMDNIFFLQFCAEPRWLWKWCQCWRTPLGRFDTEIFDQNYPWRSRYQKYKR